MNYLDELREDTAYIYEQPLPDKTIIIILNKAVDIVNKYKKNNVVEKDSLYKIIMVVYNWLLFESCYDTDTLTNYMMDKELYNRERNRFWQKWCSLRCKFPLCWHTEGTWHNKNIPLYELKKDLYIKFQRYSPIFDKIELIHNKTRYPFYSKYINEDRPLIIENWLKET
jgi:hypothetical protein